MTTTQPTPIHYRDYPFEVAVTHIDTDPNKEIVLRLVVSVKTSDPESDRTVTSTIKVPLHPPDLDSPEFVPFEDLTAEVVTQWLGPIEQPTIDRLRLDNARELLKAAWQAIKEAKPVEATIPIDQLAPA